MENKTKEKNRRTKVRKKIPNMNKIVLDYMYVHGIKSGEFEELTGIHRSSLSVMKKGTKMFVDTLYMFSQTFGHNFFIPLLQQLYAESPECRDQDPLYKQVKTLKDEIQVLKNELTDKNKR